MRALERSASRASAGESQTPAERPVSTSMSKRAPSQESTAQPLSPHPPRALSQQSSRPSTQSSTKKKEVMECTIKKTFVNRFTLER